MLTFLQDIVHSALLAGLPPLVFVDDKPLVNGCPIPIGKPVSFRWGTNSFVTVAFMPRMHLRAVHHPPKDA